MYFEISHLKDKTGKEVIRTLKSDNGPPFPMSSNSLWQSMTWNMLLALCITHKVMAR